MYAKVDYGRRVRLFAVAISLCTCIPSCTAALDDVNISMPAVHFHPTELKASIFRAQQSLQPMINPRQISRSLYSGDMERIRRILIMMFKVLTSYFLNRRTLVAVGGSITYGMGVLDCGKSWVQRLSDWCASAFPSGNVKVVNGAFPAVNSAYMKLCANDRGSFTNDITHDVRKSFERLLRKLLHLPHHPAVILLNAYQYLNIDPRNEKHKYLEGAEAFYFEMATYYGIPMASMKAAAYQQMITGIPGYWVNGTQYLMKAGESAMQNYMYWDLMHPSGTNGHRVLFDLVAAVMIRGSRSIITSKPWNSSKESGIIQDSLPPPMMEGNYPFNRNVCLVSDQFRATAVEMQGFEWVNESPNNVSPKWGFTATTAGSWIKLKISSKITQDSPALSNAPEYGGFTNQSRVPVILAYLRSYEKMVQAQIKCTGPVAPP
ncbi:hypothetical protein CEUSTIGMA_g4293.t1 [Chlamydomonas eustigma]|uniref:SGNH hydrolase-type esterase domain-containing protein n=1 Tax=Chlamydomonas eustigma TaxID=1157962 RepID=A0A250X189_9CHLO|nr:hypothetical protein CEUSTIGMA_g4293.t1 [Chlamydomonas eustigma]|eukprot:GAX76847.1 hypothetical protein CEUSTIGMA_g4293.t1 [Chlamydomonas eustigma]